MGCRRSTHVRAGPAARCLGIGDDRVRRPWLRPFGTIPPARAQNGKLVVTYRVEPVPSPRHATPANGPASSWGTTTASTSPASGRVIVDDPRAPPTPFMASWPISIRLLPVYVPLGWAPPPLKADHPAPIPPGYAPAFLSGGGGRSGVDRRTYRGYSGPIRPSLHVQAPDGGLRLRVHTVGGPPHPIVRAGPSSAVHRP